MNWSHPIHTRSAHHSLHSATRQLVSGSVSSHYFVGNIEDQYSTVFMVGVYPCFILPILTYITHINMLYITQILVWRTVQGQCLPVVSCGPCSASVSQVLEAAGWREAMIAMPSMGRKSGGCLWWLRAVRLCFIHLYPSLSIFIHLYPSLSIFIHLYPSLSIFIHLYPSLSIFIHLYPSLSIFIHLYPSLSIFIHLYPSLSIFIHLYPSLSIFILYISFHLVCLVTFAGSVGEPSIRETLGHTFLPWRSLECLLFEVFLGQTLTDGLWPHEFEHVLTKAYIRII